MIYVDVVGAQAARALVTGAAHEGGGEVLGQPLVAGALVAVAVEVVAELGADDDLVATLSQCIGQHRLALAVAVDIGGIEEGDAQVVGAAEEVYAVPLVGDPPPGGAHRPHAEADGGKAQVRTAEVAIFHARPFDIWGCASQHIIAGARVIRTAGATGGGRGRGWSR